MNKVVERRKNRLTLLQQVDRHVPISFALVGVQKAATSTIYRMLTKHPRVVGGPEKEMRFFMEEERDWRHPDYSLYVRPARKAVADVAGDATPEYFFWPHALERMRSYNPRMRLMVSLRDPVERAMSQWSMQRDRDPGFPDVPEAIRLWATDTLPDELPADMSPLAVRQTSLVTRGLYAQQLRRGYSVFPEDHWLVLDFRDIARAPEATLDRVTDHLGIERFRRHPRPIHRNITRTNHTGAPPSVADIERLVEIFAPELQDLSELCDLDTRDWATSRIARGELDVADFTETVAAKLGLA